MTNKIPITQDTIDSCVVYVRDYNGKLSRKDIMSKFKLTEWGSHLLVKKCKELKLIRVFPPGPRSKLWAIGDESKQFEKNYLEGWNGAPILGCYNTKRIYEGLHDYE